MKKKLKILLLAVGIGVVLALPLLEVPDLNQNNTIDFYVLQTGVFSDYDNAKEAQSKVSNAYIFQDGFEYRVLVGAAKREEDLLKIEQTLKEKEIPYYKKVLQIANENETLEKYNLLLEKTNDEKSISLLNRKILEEMVE